MAIVQISQITNRKGLQVDLPQLSGGELGWSTDERRLFIGNGSLEEGAPAIGNTEILTEYSNLPFMTKKVGLVDNTATATTAFTVPGNALIFSYAIIRGSTYRTGIFKFVTGAVADDSSYVQNASTGVVLSAISNSGQIEIQYTTTSTGSNATLTYTVNVSA
jgi:hypothetical protein